MKPKVVWLTGLSGAGKSTVAKGLNQAFQALNIQSYVLDGDALRAGLNKDLGFSEKDRIENIRRTAEVAKLMVDAGITVIAALISPYTKDRENARALFGQDQFIEVYISTPIEVCIERDPKGLYAKALRGEIENFTGITAPYEAPQNPELSFNTEQYIPEEIIRTMLDYLLAKSLATLT